MSSLLLPLFVKLPKVVQGYADRVLRHGAVIRRILNQTAPKTDVLHRHYVGLNEGDVAGGLVKIQEALAELMPNAQQARLGGLQSVAK